MDVQAAPVTTAPPPTPVAQLPIVAPGAPAANAGGVPQAAAVAAAVAPVAPSNASTPGASSPPAPSSSALAPAIAKLFGAGSSPAPLNLNVSYKVVNELNEVVTVFSDPHTGREIAQFPSQILIGLAEFFDQERGATLDRSA